MKCKKCGSSNDNNEKVCSNCGAALYPTIEMRWQGILAGVFAGLIFLYIAYLIYGENDWFYMGIIFSSLMAGVFATIFSKRDNIPTMEDDFNLMLHSFLAGSIFFIVIFPLMSTDPMILLYAPGIGMLAIVGAMLGYLINIARERGLKWKFAAITVSLILAAIVIYMVFFSHLHDEQIYDNKLPLGLSKLYTADSINTKTNQLINNTPIYKINDKTTLKNIKAQYQEMQNLTKISLRVSQELISYSSTPIEKQYASTLKKYSELRLNYYTEMQSAATLTLQGNQTAAKKHYNTAQTLLPQIKSQNTTLTTIQNKNPISTLKYNP